MAAINREWHEAHRMPARPTPAQRGEWHAAHHEACECREPSPAGQQLIDAHREALRHERDRNG